MRDKTKALLLSLFIMITITLIGCSNEAGGTENDSTQGQEWGEVLNISVGQQPGILDPALTTATATHDVARAMYETLVTLDDNYEVIPMLAESFEMSEDGKTITFPLRKAIKFHNGEEMTADDVIASMERWMSISAQAQSDIPGAEWEKVDEDTVAVHLQAPSAISLYTIAEQNQLPIIVPKEIAEEAGAGAIEDYIGTGPLKLDEWRTDQYIKFVKFKDYQPRSEEPTGLGGRKEALADEIYWHFVPDESTRVSGLISGEYDIILGLPYDNVGQIQDTDGLKTEIWPYGMEMLVFNKQEGTFADQKMRQAINAALDVESILYASFGDEQFFELEHGVFTPEIKAWYTDAAKDKYNMQNEDLAQQLIEESGYDGEEIVILATREYPHFYSAAVATLEQLENLGLNVSLELYDLATMLDRRDDPELWDIFFTGWNTQFIPQGYSFLDSKAGWAGWTNSEKIDQYLDDISKAPTMEEASALASDLQEEFWDYLPIINVGLFHNVAGMKENVTGFRNFIGPLLWNVGIEE
ncbi:ABC transporter substrate-binding protein [Ornithinibacillus sp. 4-3]|uniref:ABC transporter substrate-binding protein n=1 Tax=Ornithinibacillus sp. 4-3 TaxID=3231488 RepID=A0AB39HMT0_9BACI